MSKFISEPSDPFALDPAVVPEKSDLTGVLLLNLGTPDAPDAGAIRKYLREFLSDPRVVEIPKPVWQLILNLFILPTRPRQIAPKYQQVWLDEGSPLLVYGQRFATAVAASLKQQGRVVQVELAMRYGQPNIAAAIDRLRAAGCQQILVAPLYPQYAASTTATAVDAVNAYLAKLRKQPNVRYLNSFYTEEAYLSALATSINNYWQQHGKPERLLLSFHGLPQSAVVKGDPYFSHCMHTAQLLKQHLGAAGDLVHVAFQSRFGKEPWLEPATLSTLQAWGQQGLSRVDVVCPGFVADCLETLEEINIGCRRDFIAAGGGEFHYIPCLNDQSFWVQGFTEIIMQNLQSWS